MKKSDVHTTKDAGIEVFKINTNFYFLNISRNLPFSFDDVCMCEVDVCVYMCAFTHNFRTSSLWHKINFKAKFYSFELIALIILERFPYQD